MLNLEDYNFEGNDKDFEGVVIVVFKEFQEGKLKELNDSIMTLAQ